MADTRVTAVRWLVVVTTVAFLGVLSWYLGKPGYTQTRLVLFAALGGLAVTGALGVISDQSLWIAAGAGGLTLLGFWQAVLWVYIVPVVLALVIGAIVVANGTDVDAPSTESRSDTPRR